MLPAEISGSLKTWYRSCGFPRFEIRGAVPLSGGSINRVYRLSTTCGDLCLKVNAAGRYPHMFESEAQGLELLAESGEIRVPRSLFRACGDQADFLLLEYLEPAPPQPGMWPQFGASLARLHRHTAVRFGLEFDNYMGSLRQKNGFHDTWPEFFIRERLEPQVRLAMEQGYDLRRAIEPLYPELDQLFPKEPPSLIHGDLWNGNYLVTGEGTAALIDPAVCYSHREADLAMTTLFGGFPQDFYESYHAEYPLERGVKEIIAWYKKEGWL